MDAFLAMSDEIIAMDSGEYDSCGEENHRMLDKWSRGMTVKAIYSSAKLIPLWSDV